MNEMRQNIVNPRPAALRAFGLGVFVMLAALAAWKSVEANIKLSCWRQQWPELTSCNGIVGQTEQERYAKLKERLEDEPGDSQALTSLLVYSLNHEAKAPSETADLLKRAAVAAPQNADVLRLQANTALKGPDWEVAVSSLVKLSVYHRDVQANSILAQLLMVAPEDENLQAAFLEAATKGTAWLPQLVYALPESDTPIEAVLPLVHHALSNAKEGLPPQTGLFLIQQLKSRDQWLEAHAIWMQLWKRSMPFVFNGDFEQSFVPRGFDWEVVDKMNDHRSGARVSLVQRKEHGQVLKVSFTGKSMHSPIVRQYLIVDPGRYVFTGQWQSSDLRTTKGLTWVVRCHLANREIARVEPIKPQLTRQWHDMLAQVHVDEDCGPTLELALMPEARYEAQAGMRGEIVFDQFELSPVESLLP